METKGRYNSVLSLALEIEGLTVLLRRRGDLINPEIHSILEDKVTELYKLVIESKIKIDSSQDMQPVQEFTSNEDSHSNKESKIDNPTSNPIQAVQEPEISVEEVEAAVEDTVRETEEKDLSDIADAVMIEQEEDSIPAIEIESQKEDEPTEESPEILKESKINKETELQQQSETIDLLKIFTLNDRFRFRRELFNGKDEDLKSALNDISRMTSPDEIKEYLEDDLCLDMENPEVQAFYEVVVSKMPVK
ncbi:MAG: hypothetical protein J1E38_05850 [Paramuribaculum sp.]|nr:hypothetical protein [Paramuribaculum sp.]